MLRNAARNLLALPTTDFWQARRLDLAFMDAGMPERPVLHVIE